MALVVDAYARRIAGWRVPRTAHAGFVLDALERALPGRPGPSKATASSTRATGAASTGRRYVSIEYTGRPAAAGIEPPVGGVGDGHDDAPAETIVGPSEAGAIRRRGPWRGLDAVEFATPEWADWFNDRRPLEPAGGIPPARL